MLELREIDGSVIVEIRGVEVVVVWLLVTLGWLQGHFGGTRSLWWW